MTPKEEILFFKQAIRIIEKGYGKPCKDFDKNCACCKAGKVVKWMKDHIELLKNY